MSDVAIMMDVQDFWAKNNPETTKRIAESLASLRAQGKQILWVYSQDHPDPDHPFSHTPPMQVGDRDVNEMFAGHGRFSSDPGFPTNPAIAPAPGDWVIGKGPNQTDAFTNPYLEPWLRRQGGNVEVAGYMKGFCAFDTALSSTKAGFPTTFLDNLSADKNDRTDADGGDFKKAGIQVRKGGGALTEASATRFSGEVGTSASTPSATARNQSPGSINVPLLPT